MIEKYVVYLDDTVVALKYHVDRRVLTVGGNFRFRAVMEIILDRAFDKEKPDAGYGKVQKNKIRFDFKINKDTYDKGIEYLRANGYVLDSVTSLGNIMR